MTDNYDPLVLATQIEQYETMIEQIALVAQAYYQALKDSGMPDNLAYELVKEWHTIWWTMIIGVSLSHETSE
jgi:hypothetical protein